MRGTLYQDTKDKTTIFTLTSGPGAKGYQRAPVNPGSKPSFLANMGELWKRLPARQSQQDRDIALEERCSVASEGKEEEGDNNSDCVL